MSVVIVRTLTVLFSLTPIVSRNRKWVTLFDRNLEHPVANVPVYCCRWQSDNDVPFYVALPSTTIDWNVRDGVLEIPIEERDPLEVRETIGVSENRTVSVRTITTDTAVRNYAFDVTPARLITGLITDRGLCDASEEGLLQLYPEMRKS